MHMGKHGIFGLYTQADWIASEVEDAQNKGLCMSVEMSRSLLTLITFLSHCILQSGRSIWSYQWYLWVLQVLFNNVLTCAEGHGNHTNAISGIVPLSVSEYLCSANCSLLIP
jgi:hypothetical protein